MDKKNFVLLFIFNGNIFHMWCNLKLRLFYLNPTLDIPLNDT